MAVASEHQPGATSSTRNGSVSAMIAVAVATSSDRNLRAYAKLDDLRRLRPGWDGYDGVPPSDITISQVKAFIASIPSDAGMPEIEASGDGEINLVWRSAAAYLEIGFTGDDSFSFLGKDMENPDVRVFGDVPLLTNRLPLAVHAYMGRFNAGVRVRDRESERESLTWVS